MENKFYTIDKVAEILGMHHKTVRKFITEGKLQASKVGKQWRISGHDLSLFLEGNNKVYGAGINGQINVKESNLCKTNSNDNDIADCNVEEVKFTTANTMDSDMKKQVKVSTVIDITHINIDQYIRISNMLLAVMNCRDEEMKDATINMNYSKDTERLRVMLWGGTKFIENMLVSVDTMMDNSNL